MFPPPHPSPVDKPRLAIIVSRDYFAVIPSPLCGIQFRVVFLFSPGFNHLVVEKLIVARESAPRLPGVVSSLVCVGLTPFVFANVTRFIAAS